MPDDVCARTRYTTPRKPELDANRIMHMTRTNIRKAKREKDSQHLPPTQLHPSHTTTTTRPHPRTCQANTQKQILPSPRRRQLGLPKRTLQHNLAIRAQNLRARARHLWRARQTVLRIRPIACARIARLAKRSGRTSAAHAVAVGWAAVAFQWGGLRVGEGADMDAVG